MKLRSIGKQTFYVFICLMMAFCIVCAPASTLKVHAMNYMPGNPTYNEDGPIWDCIWFGNYYQSNSTTKEPIKWRVLKVSGNDAFIISDKNLDCQPYNMSNEDVTWETCSLRTWLNTSFYNKAFNESERNAIFTTHVQTHDNVYFDMYEDTPGADTYDKVYLLSLEEAIDTDYGFGDYDLFLYDENPEHINYDSSRAAKNTEHTKSGSESGKVLK